MDHSQKLGRMEREPVWTSGTEILREDRVNKMDFGLIFYKRSCHWMKCGLDGYETKELLGQHKHTCEFLLFH